MKTFLLTLGGLILKLIDVFRPKKKSVLDQLTQDALKDLKSLDKELKNAIHHQKIAVHNHHTQQSNYWRGMRQQAESKRVKRVYKYGLAVLRSLGHTGPDTG